MNWISRSINETRARRFLRASSYRTALEGLPEGLERSWRDSAAQEYPGIRTDAFFFVRAADGLLRFFDAVSHSEAPCALPSEAADSVWHAWLRHDPIGLERYCRRHFGLDARLRMPGGHGYWNRGDEIVHARLNQRGRCLGRPQAHPELLTAALLAAGLVDADMVLAHMRLQQAAATGSSCGSFADGSFAFAGDGGCSDSGDSGGDGD